MHPIDFTKHFLPKHYPRHFSNSALLLAFLSVFLLIFSNLNPRDNSESSNVTDLITPNVSKTTHIETTPYLQISESFSNTLTPDSLEFTPNSRTALSSWKHVEVGPGDNLSAIFTRVGLSNQELFRLLNSDDKAKILNHLFPGYQLSFAIPKPGHLEQLKVLMSPVEGYLFTLIDGFYEVESIERTPQIKSVFKHGTISDSLFMAGQKEQIPDLTLMEMAEIFGGVIDFVLDPRLGDNFSILFEEKYLDGEFIGTGDILAAQFTNQGKQHIAVKYENEAGAIGYYNLAGESMRKAFLRAPIDVFRISSNFSPARLHPVLNTIRAHRGTDYAAPKGTPVFATSDGIVTWAAKNGSFGRLVTIKHDGDFETKYAHLSEFANGVKKGQRVLQGDIVGYVGSTGSATGPHLHYEFLMNGVHQNPRTILEKLPKPVSISATEINAFHESTAPLIAQFKSLEASRMLTLRQQGAE